MRCHDRTKGSVGHRHPPLESARGVFRAKLHNLGVQFAIRVTDQNWSEALVIGEQIMDEYPNTRMAQEVQEKQRLAEATSEVEEKKARAKKAGGRSLLVKTSPRGISTLGGN